MGARAAAPPWRCSRPSWCPRWHAWWPKGGPAGCCSRAPCSACRTIRGPPGSPAQHQRQARPHWCSLPAPRRSPSGTLPCRTPSICSLAIIDKVRVIQVLQILGHPNVQNIIHVRYLQHFRKSKHGLYECRFRFRDSPCFYPLLFIRGFPWFFLSSDQSWRA